MVRKHRVLKLVHPGGFVEIHKNPITAYEVMKKNPRHCVTRPDVFKFPWIVIRPESVLNVGNVFYIVPFRTIHCLLRRRKRPFENNSLPSMDSSLAGLTCFHELANEQCPKLSPARSKIDFKFDDLPDDAMFPKCLVQDSPCRDDCQCEGRKSAFEVELEKPDDSRKKVYFDDQWSSDFGCEDSQEASPKGACDGGSGDDDTYRDDSGLRSNCYPIENKVLKSCLKKENIGKPREFKVKFVIPNENDEINVTNAIGFQEKL